MRFVRGAKSEDTCFALFQQRVVVRNILTSVYKLNLLAKQIRGMHVKEGA